MPYTQRFAESTPKIFSARQIALRAIDDVSHDTPTYRDARAAAWHIFLTVPHNVPDFEIVEDDLHALWLDAYGDL